MLELAAAVSATLSARMFILNTIGSGQAIANRVAQLITKLKQLISLSVSITPLKNKFEEEIGVAVIARKIENRAPERELPVTV